MIPHAPPVRFEVEDGAVVLPAEHPLARDGRYPVLALVELAAQLAGRAAPVGAGHAGMLVEVVDLETFVPEVSAGARMVPEVRLERSMGPLHQFVVILPGVLSGRFTLRIAP